MPNDFANAVINNIAGDTVLQSLKKFMGIDPADVDEDVRLSAACDLSGDIIEAYLDRLVLKRETTQNFPHYFDTVVLHHYPVTGDVTVTLDGNVDPSYTWYKDASGLAHLSKSGQPWDIPMDWRKFDNVEVTYTAGFDPLPNDLAYGIVNMASLLFEADGDGEVLTGGSNELRSFQLYDVGSLNYQTNSQAGQASMLQGGMIPNSVAVLISRYRRWST